MEEPSFCLYVVGRLRGVTRDRLSVAVRAAGGRLVRAPSSKVTVVALSHGSALTTLAEAPPLRLPDGIPFEAELISEGTLRQRLGLSPLIIREHRQLSLADLRGGSGLDPEILRCLALYDVLEPVDGDYSFRDLRAAREAARLLASGYGLDEIVEASILLRHSGRGLFDTSIGEAPWGEVMQVVGGRMGQLDGQYVLSLEDDCETADEIFARAEECELAGDLAGAERHYRIALRMEQSDPVIPFNLGNVVDAQGRPAEAVLLYQLALTRDASFPEAWVNLGAVHERAGRALEAERSLRCALRCQPEWELALHNLALLLTRQARYTEALPLWERYLTLQPRPEHISSAMRLRALCRWESRGKPDLE